MPAMAYSLLKVTPQVLYAVEQHLNAFEFCNLACTVRTTRHVPSAIAAYIKAATEVHVAARKRHDPALRPPICSQWGIALTVTCCDTFTWLTVCGRGYLELAKWMAATFDIDGPVTTSCGLRYACEHGKIMMAMWLTNTFGVTTGVARMSENAALQWACANGHLNVVQWLISHFGLTKQDAHIFPFREACHGGHLHVAQWLTERFGLTAKDARVNKNYALVGACLRGHVHVAQWLVDTFGLDTSNFGRYGLEDTFIEIVCKSTVEMMQWAVTTFGFTWQQHKSMLMTALSLCNPKKYNQTVKAKWLVRRFPEMVPGTDWRGNVASLRCALTPHDDAELADWVTSISSDFD